jgi:hypothetical protein
MVLVRVVFLNDEVGSAAAYDNFAVFVTRGYEEALRVFPHGAVGGCIYVDHRCAAGVGALADQRQEFIVEKEGFF